ncbi:MAG: amidohydrolase family protein [Marinicellaceae bacterium]
MNTFKKISKWVLIFILLSTPFSLFYTYTEINRLWGEYTEQVDHNQFYRPQADLVIQNVQVLTSDGSRMLANQSVVIQDGVIVSMGKNVLVPAGYKVIDGNGQYLIPGMIDSHVHLWQSPNDLLLYLANGITHIKEMNGSEEHLQWKQEIQQGRPGPDMFVASRRHNSTGLLRGWFDRLTAKINPVNEGDNIEAELLDLIAQGFDAIKVYTFLSKAHFLAFDAAAKQHGFQILGHTPITMKLNEIWGTEFRELGHVEELVKALNREFGGFQSKTAEAYLKYVRSRSDEIVKQLLKHDVAVQTTLTLMQDFAPIREDLDAVLSGVQLPYVNPGIAESTHPSIRAMGWLPEVNIYRLPDDYPDELKAGNQMYWETYAEANRILIRAMAEGGVKLLAATDANVPVMVPGFSLHEELISLQQVGMSNSAVLQAATKVPAQAMDIKTGVVGVGYQADLLLLSANPLESISNTQKIEMVINNGRVYDRSTLDQILAAVKAANNSSRTSDISHYH